MGLVDIDPELQICALEIANELRLIVGLVDIDPELQICASGVTI